MKKLMVLFVIVFTYLWSFAQVDFSLKDLNYFEQIKFIEETRNQTTVLSQMSDKDKKRYFRYRAFWDNRVDSDGSFTSYIKAWQTYANTNQGNKSADNADAPNLNFENIGPFEYLLDERNNIGRAQSVAVDPTNSNIVYLGSMSGGIWKTYNALDAADLVSWECLSDNFPSIGVFDIVINPDNNQEVYFVSGFVNSNLSDTRVYGNGIYKSTDGGQTWVCDFALNPEDKILLTRIVFHPTNHNIMYALGHNRLYRKQNNGEWEQISGEILSTAAQLWEIVIDPVNPEVIYASGRSPNLSNGGLYKSTDGGYHFTDITSHLGTSNTSSSLIAIDYNTTDSCIYTMYYNGRLKKSSDGNVWNNASSYDSDCFFFNYVGELEIAPNGDIYVGGRYMYYSSDYNTFEKLKGNIHQDIRDVAFSNSADGGPVFIATDGGICRNMGIGKDGWESINGNLCITQFFDLAISENNSEFMLGGAADCGTIRRNPDGTWSHVLGSDGGGSGIDNFDYNKCVGSYGPGSQSIRYTTDSFHTDYSSYFYDHSFSVPIYNSPVHFSKHIPNRVYVGTWNLTCSTNGGQLFKNNVAGMPEQVIEIDESPIDSLHFAFSVFNRVETDSCSKIYVSNNYNYDSAQSDYDSAQYNNKWVCYDYTNFGSPDFSRCPITGIDYSDVTSDELYICLSRFKDGLKVFKSPDEDSSNWINMSYNLPNIPINDIAEDDESGYLYAATDFGLYYLKLNDTVWHQYQNIPLMSINKILINQSSGEIILNAYGRGVWRSDLPCHYVASESVNIESNTYWNETKKIRGNLTISNASTLRISNDLKLSNQSVVTIKNGSKLIVDTGGIIENGCNVYFGGIINVEAGGILEIRDGGKIQMGENGLINVKTTGSLNGLLSYNETLGTGGIILKDSTTCLNISGNLHIAENAQFTFSGDGYIKFSNPGGEDEHNITCGDGASIVFEGNDKDDKILEVQQSTVRFPENLTALTFKNGKIEMGNDKRMLADGNYPITFSNIKLTSDNGVYNGHRSFFLFGQGNVEINNCIFENGKYGLSDISYFGSDLQINNSIFQNNTIGLDIENKGVTLFNCTFKDNSYYGLNAWYMEWESSFSYCNFINNYVGISYRGSATADLLINKSIISNNTTNGLYVSGTFDTELSCCQISNNENGIYNRSSRLFFNKGKINTFSENDKSININSGYLFLNNANNILTPKTGGYSIFGSISPKLACNNPEYVLCNSNYWSSSNQSPTLGSDYKTYKFGCSNNVIMYILDNTPLSYPSSCFIGQVPDSLHLKETFGLSTSSFVNDLSTGQSIAAQYQSLSQLEPDNLSENNLVNLFNAYTPLIESSTGTSIPEITDIQIKAWGKIHNVLDKYYLKIGRDYNNAEFNTMVNQLIALNGTLINNIESTEEAIINYKLDIALLNRLRKNYTQSISQLEQLLIDVEAEPLYLAEINAWLCHVEQEKLLHEGQITPDEFYESVAECEFVYENNLEQILNEEVTNENTLSVQETSHLNISPNPNNGSFTVSIENAVENSQLQIVNTYSQPIAEKQITTDNPVFNFNGFSSGFYTVYYLVNGVVVESKGIVVE